MVFAPVVKKLCEEPASVTRCHDSFQFHDLEHHDGDVDTKYSLGHKAGNKLFGYFEPELFPLSVMRFIIEVGFSDFEVGLCVVCVQCTGVTLVKRVTWVSVDLSVTRDLCAALRARPPNSNPPTSLTCAIQN